MKRLGFWNRLAIVLTVLAFFIAPALIAADISKGLSDLRTTTFEFCVSPLKGKEAEPGYSEKWRECFQEMTAERTSSPWDDYWVMAFNTLLFCAILYLIIWAIVATAKWVWRGRG